MARSQASTTDEYLASLPDERREIVSAIRDLVVVHLPDGSTESVDVIARCVGSTPPAVFIKQYEAAHKR